MRRRLLPALLLVLLCACGPQAPTTRGTPRPATASAAAPASPAPSVLAATPGGANPALPTQGPLLPAALTGKVKGPAALLGEYGSGIVSNNGGGLRLLALAPQVPAVGVKVRLLDAAGQPVNGADGKPLEAPTDATGTYRFASLPADHNLVLQVGLETGGGLTAVVPRSSKATDVDLVSTLTTTYILSEYVASQANPVETLDKLPADVEAATRGKAAAALEAGKVPLPDALTPQQVVATVESLRKGDGGLDAQLETVRKLLIVAGQSNLGEGLPGTEVDLDGIGRLLADAAGTLFIVSPTRIWRLAPDGKLQTAYGGGANGTARTAIASADLDARGNLLVLEPNPTGDGLRVVRQAIGGSATPLGTLPSGSAAGQAIWADGEGARVLTNAGAAGITLWSLQPGRAATQQVVLASDANIVGPVGRAADGTLYARSSKDGQYVTALAPGASSFKELYGFHALQTPGPDAGKTSGMGAIAPDGRLVVRDGYAGKVLLVAPNGSQRVILDDLPEGVYGLDTSQFRAALAPDGTVYLGYAGFGALADVTWQVYRIQDGAATRVAGLTRKASPAPTAENLALHLPASLATGADGTIWVLDEDKVQRIAPDRQVTQLTTFSLGGITLKPARLRADAAGNLYTYLLPLIGAPTLNRIDTAGQLTALYTSPMVGVIGLDYFLDLAVAPDGGLAAIANHYDGDSSYTPQLLLGTPPTFKRVTLGEAIGNHTKPADAVPAYDPAGTLYLARANRIERVAADGSLTKVADVGLAVGERFAVDARGRCYFARGKRVERFDPASKTTSAIAGAGSPHFAGAGVDDGLGTIADLAFEANGALLLLDKDNKQLKRIPAAEL